MPALPTGLRPVVEGFSTAGPGGARRTEVAGGMARYGLEFDRGYQQFQVTLKLSDMEFSVWTAFYHQIVKKGAIAFDMPLDSWRGTEVHSVNIVPGTYQAARAAGAHTVVSMAVEGQSTIYSITAAEAQALIDAFVATTGKPLVNLLRPLVSSYSFDGPGGVARTEIPGGLPQFALAVDRDPQAFRVALVLSKAEYKVWAAYYHHIVKKGVLSFPMYLDSGFGASLHTVNVVPGSYQAARAGALTAVSFVVEAEGEANDLTTAEAQAFVDLFNTSGVLTDDLLARIAQFANVDTLVLDL